MTIANSGPVSSLHLLGPCDNHSPNEGSCVSESLPSGCARSWLRQPLISWLIQVLHYGHATLAVRSVPVLIPNSYIRTTFISMFNQSNHPQYKFVESQPTKQEQSLSHNYTNSGKGYPSRAAGLKVQSDCYKGATPYPGLSNPWHIIMILLTQCRPRWVLAVSLDAH
jgi:hypothetical protein